MGLGTGTPRAPCCLLCRGENKQIYTLYHKDNQVFYCLEIHRAVRLTAGLPSTVPFHSISLKGATPQRVSTLTPHPSLTMSATPYNTNTSESGARAIFTKFDSYPWGRDRPFLQGLVAMLGPLTPGYEKQTALGISLQARIWWYKSRLDIEIDRAAYEEYLKADPSASCPDPALLSQIQEIQQRMAAVSARPDLPDWQLQAPKVDPNKKAEDRMSNHAGGEGQDAPYPAHFQAIIEAVTMGKPVPGVREIPNTVVRQPGITPVGKMQAPKKPWEKNQEASTTTTTHELTNQEFPPVLDDNATEATS